MAAERRTMIITFKKKDRRQNKSKDKQEIFTDAVKSEVNFFTADDFDRGMTIPSSMPQATIGYDVNQYEAPILIASLTEEEIAALKDDKNVARVEEDGQCYALGAIYTTDQLLFEGQLTVQAETVPSGVVQIKAPDAWECSRGKAVKVAVLDTGIDSEHPDLKPNFKMGVSFVPDESSWQDFNGHGTHCAGTIAAAINGSGVVGVAPNAYLYAVKVLSRTGSGNWSWLIAGLDWCVNKKKMNIVSMSLGGSTAPAALEEMCEMAFKQGVLLVGAAGNSGGNVGFPARYDSVIAVSAIDSSNTIANFSSRGPAVELCAPGVDVLSTWPGGGYRRLNGTSMATPHVAGAAALAWGSHRYSNNVTIRRLLAWRANNLGNPGRDDLYGFGRVDAEQVACEFDEPPSIPGLP